MRYVDLRISFRNGLPRLGYLYLSDPKEKSARSRRVELGMVLDFNQDGKLIGIELLAPQRITLEAINKILKEYEQEPLKESDLAPIFAA
jgi:uncharacterized protein YuzE